jgi:hypothetical protein
MLQRLCDASSDSNIPRNVPFTFLYVQDKQQVNRHERKKGGGRAGREEGGGVSDRTGLAGLKLSTGVPY